MSLTIQIIGEGGALRDPCSTGHCLLEMPPNLLCLTASCSAPSLEFCTLLQDALGLMPPLQLVFSASSAWLAPRRGVFRTTASGQLLRSGGSLAVSAVLIAFGADQGGVMLPGV